MKPVAPQKAFDEFQPSFSQLQYVLFGFDRAGL